MWWYICLFISPPAHPFSPPMPRPCKKRRLTDLHSCGCDLDNLLRASGRSKRFAITSIGPCGVTPAIGSNLWNILSSPLRLVPTPGMFSLVLCDWFQPLECSL